MESVPVDAAKWTLAQADDALRRLLDATLSYEKTVATRDTEIAVILKRHAKEIDGAAADIATLNTQIEQFYARWRERLLGIKVRTETEERELKELKLRYGTLGINIATTPALVPLNAKWTWDKIGAKLRRVFKARFFHTPKPPGIDKVKVKAELSAEQLAQCGMKLEYSESFYIELNRLKEVA